jgi:hypothetical protein
MGIISDRARSQLAANVNQIKGNIANSKSPKGGDPSQLLSNLTIDANGKRLIQYDELSKREKFKRFLSDFFSFSSPSAERQVQKALLLGRLLKESNDPKLEKIRTVYYNTFLHNENDSIQDLAKAVNDVNIKNLANKLNRKPAKPQNSKKTTDESKKTAELANFENIIIHLQPSVPKKPIQPAEFAKSKNPTKLVKPVEHEKPAKLANSKNPTTFVDRENFAKSKNPTKSEKLTTLAKSEKSKNQAFIKPLKVAKREDIAKLVKLYKLENPTELPPSLHKDCIYDIPEKPYNLRTVKNILHGQPYGTCLIHPNFTRGKEDRYCISFSCPWRTSTKNWANVITLDLEINKGDTFSCVGINYESTEKDARGPKCDHLYEFEAKRYDSLQELSKDLNEQIKEKYAVPENYVWNDNNPVHWDKEAQAITDKNNNAIWPSK